MKTFCVVMPDHTHYTIQAESVFEMTNELAMHEDALRFCLAEKRPFSLRVANGWITKLAHKVPLIVNQRKFVCVHDPLEKR